MKSSEVCIKTESNPASLPLKGQVNKHKTRISCSVQSGLQSVIQKLTLMRPYGIMG